jgi:hypothetical protein
MFNGMNQNIAVTTYPAHAKLTVDTQPGNTNTAPTTLRLRRGKQHRISASQDGYEDASAALTSHVDGMAIALDCIVWLCVPILFEWPMGAIYELEPASVTSVLEAKPPLGAETVVPPAAGQR